MLPNVDYAFNGKILALNTLNQISLTVEKHATQIEVLMLTKDQQIITL